MFRDCVISSETRNGDTGHVCLYYLSQFFILFWECISIEVQAPSLHYKSKDYLCLAYALCCFKLQQMHGLTCSMTYNKQLCIVKDKFIVDDVNLSVLQVAFDFISIIRKISTPPLGMYSKSIVHF